MKTNLLDVQNQIQTFWSDMFMPELREQLLIGSLVNKDYQGSIGRLGDTVRVSQIVSPNGELKTVGVDADTFSPEKLVTQYVDIKADKRAVGSFEFEDLVMLQSQIGNKDSEIRASLVYAVQKQINDYLFSLVNPSVSSPTHVITGVTNFNAGEISKLRKLASQAKWLRNKPWYILADPSYYKDMLDAQTLTSADFVGDQPVIGGQIVNQRFGWNIIEDNSEGLSNLSAAGIGGEDVAVAFHPDFMHLVMQTEPQFKLSDLHSNKQFGFVLSVDVVFGAKLGIDGNLKHIKITA
jgi:hypothetical protein